MNLTLLPPFIALIAGVFLAFVGLSHARAARWRSAWKFGGLGLLLVGVTILVGMAASSKMSKSRLPESVRPRPLLPERSSSAEHSGEPDTMTLVLGGVRVRVPVSNQYDLSADNEIFLTVSSSGPGLLVSCRAATGAVPYSASSQLAADISENTVVFRGHEVATRRPDPHTIVVEKDGAETLRVHYPEQGTLEVTGSLQFTSGVVILEQGILWPPRNFIPPGPVDLTARRSGRIDFQPSGVIRVVSR